MRGGGVSTGGVIAMLASGPLLSPWVVYPMSAVTMLAVALHAVSLTDAHMPESRRRIRRVNAMLMLVCIPLLGYGFGGVGGHDPREFVLVWSASVLLLAVIVAVAMVDILNTARLHHREARELRRRILQARARLAALARGELGDDGAATAGGQVGQARRAHGTDGPRDRAAD